MTYDARHHHVSTRLTVITRDVVMVHGAQRSVWNLGLEVDAVVERGRVLVVSELLRHLGGCVGCSVGEAGRCRLCCELDGLALRRVGVIAVGSCGVVVNKDVVDAGRGRTTSRVVVDLGARWGSGGGGSYGQRLVTLASVGMLLVLAV